MMLTNEYKFSHILLKDIEGSLTIFNRLYFSISWARTWGSWAWQSIRILISVLLAGSKSSCQGFSCFSLSFYIFYILYIFFIATFFSRFSFHKYLFFIERFPYYSATLFCLSFNFPIFSIKRGRSEVDASILCLIGFPFLPRERFRTISFSSRNFLFFFPFFFQFEEEYLFRIYKSSTKMYYMD